MTREQKLQSKLNQCREAILWLLHDAGGWSPLSYTRGEIPEMLDVNNGFANAGVKEEWFKVKKRKAVPK